MLINRDHNLWALSPREAMVWAVAMVVFCAAGILPHLNSAGPRAQVEWVSVENSSSVALNGGPVWRLDLNAATQAELEMLPGIGPRRAALILEQRKKRGAFRSVWELSEVPSLSRSLIQRLEPLVTALPPASLQNSAPK